MQNMSYNYDDIDIVFPFVQKRRCLFVVGISTLYVLKEIMGGRISHQHNSQTNPQFSPEIAIHCITAIEFQDVRKMIPCNFPIFLWTTTARTSSTHTHILQTRTQNLPNAKIQLSVIGWQTN
jgi:hypothetical protein